MHRTKYYVFNQVWAVYLFVFSNSFGIRRLHGWCFGQLVFSPTAIKVTKHHFSYILDITVKYLFIYDRVPELLESSYIAIEKCKSLFYSMNSSLMLNDTICDTFQSTFSVLFNNILKKILCVHVSSHWKSRQRAAEFY